MNDLLLTAAQMRALERAAIESGAVTGLELMERAGVGSVAAIEAEWPELAAAQGRAVVLCGPGNNGGDGFVVARLLARKGWEVEVFLYGDAKKLPPDARVNCGRWREIGEIVSVGFPVPHPEACDLLTGKVCAEVARQRPLLVVDALFGTGLSRSLHDLDPFLAGADLDETKRRFPGADRFQPFHIALDIPSGVCADSGRVLGSDPEKIEPPVVGANLTLAFHSLKLGHVLAEGPSFCDRIRVVDIGLGNWLARDDEALRSKSAPDRLSVDRSRFIREITPDDWHPRLHFRDGGHKYAHGHALVLTGGFGRTGAARLAARAALRIGAGLVTVGAPGSAMMECAAQLTAIMLRRCDDADALEGLLDDTRLNALCLGPGLGTDARASGLVAAALAAGRPTVLDADALTLIAGDESLRAALHDRCVLTPHGGEFARLFPDLAERLEAPATTGPAFSKVDAVREAAQQAGCTVLLKGPDTVIADSSGRASVNAAVYDRAAPWLATAGAGDVLSGIIAGLLARGLPVHDAAAAAAWLHVEAARAFGPGLIAEDLPEALPAVLRALG